MSKFNWDEFIGYDKLAMDSDGCVYAFSGGIVYDEEQGVWIKENPMSGKMLPIFEPALEVLQGFVDPIERPDLPPDWWFSDQVKDDGITKVDFDGQEEGEQYIGAPGSKPTDLDVDEKTNRVWINAEEFNFAAYYYKMRHEDWMQSHESLMQHLGGKFLNFTETNPSQDWTTNDTLDFGKSIYDKHAELARQAIWTHFEENECLPDFLVGDTEVLGPFFMGIKIIDDEA